LLPPASVKHLGYPAPTNGTNGATRWFVQEAALGLRYCVAVGSWRVGDRTLLALTITSSANSADPVKTACDEIAKALAIGYEPWFRLHGDHWQDFWSQSHVMLPELDILRRYYLVQHVYGAASRAVPIALQGLWMLVEC
jgi:alpha-L-fucosidase 2